MERSVVDSFYFWCGPSLRAHHRRSELREDFEFRCRAFRNVWFGTKQRERPAKMSNRFRVRGAPHGALARRRPVGDGILVETGLAIVIGQQFGLALHDGRIMLLQSLRDMPMKLLAQLAQQRAVGGVLHQCVLKDVGRFWRGAALEEQSSLDQPTQRVLHICVVSLPRDCCEQLIRELSADRGADLRHFLRGRAESVEPGHE